MNFFGHDYLSGFRRINQIGAYHPPAWTDQESQYYLKEAFIWKQRKVRQKNKKNK